MTSIPFAPLPLASLRLSLGPEEWEACLDSWLSLAELTLRVPVTHLSLNAGDKASLPGFLVSFYHELVTVRPDDNTLITPKAIALRKHCFKIVARIYTGNGSIPSSLLDSGFLSNFCHVHVKSTALKQLMAKLWQQKSDEVAPKVQKQKDAVVSALDSKNIEPAMILLNQCIPIVHVSADIGSFLLTGSDFLDSLMSGYTRATTDAQRKAISTILFLCIISLVQTEKPNISLLSDHLYSLKSQADKSPPAHSVLADVVTNTPLLSRLRHSAGAKAPDRLFRLLDTLETSRAPSLARPRKRVNRARSTAKGKQRASQADFHIHRISLVTQVQDLFPDLGSAFVLKLLDEYNDDVEQVTAHLLDDSLPAHLASLDRTEEAPIQDSTALAEIDHLAPRSTPPPPDVYISERRNVFDNDEFDRLDFDTSKLHIGKRSKSVAGSDQPNKAAILSALAAFDSDDDERDDTYDVEDVGGTIDSAHPDGEPGPAARVTLEENDMALFTAYRSAPEMFGRTFDVRKGQARMALKSETGMTDEQIEGWAVMLQRDPKRLKRLEAQAGDTFAGQQPELARTSYRESPGNTETEDSDAPGGGRGGFRGRGRGRGRGGRGRGNANVAGPSSDPNTAQAQRRKEANKSSRANHNRRDQRAKKLARGGFSG